MSGWPKEEELLRVDPAQLQSALASLSDEMAAAALQGFSPKVAERIRAALSSRRRSEIEAEGRTYPERTREVARRLLLRTVFDLDLEEEEEEEEEKAPDVSSPPEKDSLHKRFLMKLAARHPVFVQARKARMERAWMEHLKRIVREE